MMKLIRGILILIALVLIFMVITACTSANGLMKKDKQDKISDNKNLPESEEYTFNNNNESGDENKTKDKSISGVGDYYEKGLASWYGREFQGRKTASGDKFDMNKLTAAHKKLPFGTKVLVRNFENDSAVTVTINDRGPYKSSRIIDLSYAAANKLGIVSDGQAMVGIKIIGEDGSEENWQAEDKVVGVNYDKEDKGINKDNDNNEKYAENDGSGNYSLQAGAFYSRRNAEKLQKHIEELVDNPVTVVSDNDTYKVRVEKIATKNKADKLKKILDKEKISSFVIENRE